MSDPPPGITPSSNELSDRTLLRRFRAGEDDAATALYLRYAKRLQSLAEAQTGTTLATRVDAEDIVQSVFRTFFRRAADGHYNVPDGEELWKLFLVIALNKIRGLGLYHGAAKRNVKQTTPLSQIGGALHDPQGGNENAYHVLQLTIRDILQNLPDIQQKMVLLRIEGHNVQAIAARTERSKRSVERVLQQFRARLSEQLQADV